MKGSGKVTVWHAPGLYAVNAGPLAESADIPSSHLAHTVPTASSVLATLALVTSTANCVVDGETAANSPLFAASNGNFILQMQPYHSVQTLITVVVLLDQQDLIKSAFTAEI